MKDYTNVNPAFSDSIKIFESTDPVDAESVDNIPLKQLQDNILYLKERMVNTLETEEDVSERLDACEQNILALLLAFSIEQEAEVNGTAGNIVVEVFDSASGYIIISGVYDSANHRIYT